MLPDLQLTESKEDRAKFQLLYDHYAGLMYDTAMQYLKNEQDREDAVQTAFESIARNIKKLSAVDSPQTYSYIVHTIESKSIDVLRKQQRQTAQLDEAILGVRIELPEDDELETALAKLPAHYCEILLLGYDCGYTAKELAAMLGMTRGSVQKQIWRPKEALKKLLGEKGAPLEKHP